MKTTYVSIYRLAFFFLVFGFIYGMASYGEDADEEKISQAANYMYYGYADNSKDISSPQFVTVLVAWWLEPVACDSDSDSDSDSGYASDFEKCFGYKFVQEPNISEAFAEASKVLHGKNFLIYGLSWADVFKQEDVETRSIKVRIGISEQVVSRDFIYIEHNSGDQKIEVIDNGYSPYILNSTRYE